MHALGLQRGRTFRDNTIICVELRNLQPYGSWTGGTEKSNQMTRKHMMWCGQGGELIQYRISWCRIARTHGSWCVFEKSLISVLAGDSLEIRNRFNRWQRERSSTGMTF